MLSFVEQGKDSFGQRLHLVLGCIEFLRSWSSRQAISLLCFAFSESMKSLKVEAWGPRRKGLGNLMASRRGRKEELGGPGP